MIFSLSTIPLSYNYYLELIITDQGPRTCLMKKVSAPNHFKDVINVPGDQRQHFFNEFLKRVPHKMKHEVIDRFNECIDNEIKSHF